MIDLYSSHLIQHTDSTHPFLLSILMAAEYGEGSLTNRMQGWLGADLWRQKDGWTLSHQVLKQQKTLSLAGRLPLKAWNAGILTKVLVLNIVLSY